MRKILPAVFLVASCVGGGGGGAEPETIYGKALEQLEKQTDEEKRLRILEDAIDDLGHYSYAFKLRDEADGIWESRQRRSCEKSDVGREECVSLLQRLHVLQAEDDPRTFVTEVHGFVKAHKGTDLALDLRLCYRKKLLAHLEHTEQKPIPWGAELPEALGREEEGKPGRRNEAELVARFALEEIKISPADHSKNRRRLGRALARVMELDPASPFATALEDAMAEEKKAIDRRRSKDAQKAMTEAVNRADGKGALAKVRELEAIEEQILKTPVERIWRQHLEDARRELAGEEERQRREERAAAAAKTAMAQVESCGLDYEKAVRILRSALEEVKGRKAERGLEKMLAEVEEKTPESLNAKAVAILKMAKKRKRMERIDAAVVLLDEIIEQENYTKRIDFSGSLAFEIGAALASRFFAYRPKLAQARKFTSTYDEAVHYYILAASRNSENDRGLLEAAELLLKMKLPGRARRCLEEARGSSQLNVRNEAERRLRELDARTER